MRFAGYAETLPTVPVRRLAMLATSPDVPMPRNADDPMPDNARTVSARMVSPDFLSSMGIRLVAGRGFGEGDGAGQPQVMLINQTLARSGFFGDQPLGKRIYALGNVTFDPRRLRPSGGAPQPWEIVGIVDNVRQSLLELESGPEIFVDFRQLPGPSGPPGSARYSRCGPVAIRCRLRPASEGSPGSLTVRRWSRTSPRWRSSYRTRSRVHGCTRC